jgi:hypothetical protein
MIPLTSRKRFLVYHLSLLLVPCLSFSLFTGE